MKKNILFGILACLFFLMCYAFYQGNMFFPLETEIFSHKEIFFSGGAKYPTQFSTAEKYIYTLKNISKIPKFSGSKNCDLSDVSFFYSYPLKFLPYDLSVVSIEGYDHDGVLVYEAPNMNLPDSFQNDVWFNTYQFPDRNRDQIFSFLQALSEERNGAALDLLSQNKNLIPFPSEIPLYRKEGTGGLDGVVIIPDMAGPLYAKSHLCLDRKNLYQTFQIIENLDDVGGIINSLYLRIEL